jgi:long-chain acyl-CoA synthetase
MKATRLFDHFHNQYDEGILSPCLSGKIEEKWVEYSTADVIRDARELASGMIEMGLQPGDKVGIVSYKNRPEWLITDLAIQYIAAVSVPMYPTISAREYEYIMDEAGVKLCFVGDGDLYDKVSAAQAKVSSLREIVCYDRQGGRPYWRDTMSQTNLKEVEEISKTVKEDDLFTIIYTSGTTGNPKGVMLTHANVESIVSSCRSILPVEKGDKVLSFLPLCHIFERVVVYVYAAKSVQIYFTGTDNLGGESGDLVNVKPHYFTTVPRLLEKVYEKIYSKGEELEGFKRKIFFWALSLTDSYEHDNKPSGWLGIQASIADKLVFSKWRSALGGNLKGIAIGASACPIKINRTFTAAGITVMEGYGLTETSPVISVNYRDSSKNKIGTVGPVLDIVDLVFEAEDGTINLTEGEILVHGPNNFLGYYNQPELTAGVFKEINGKRYFRTGDIGTYVTDKSGTKYLKITDRKKELLKTSGGKYVAPTPIEALLKGDFLVEQAMVVGDNLKFVSALIVPSIDGLISYCKKNHIDIEKFEDMIKDSRVLSYYQNVVDKVNSGLGHIEQIKKFSIVPMQWEPTKADGTDSELTPTLKLKRRVITQKYKDLIDEMYK